MANTQNVRIEPMIAYFGKDTAQVETITTVADVTDSLDGKAIVLHTVAGVKHYFWFNTSGGSAVDPAYAGATAHAVAIATDATANAVATALQGVIDATTEFVATVSSNVVTVTHAVVGAAQSAHDAVATGFTFGVSVYGELKEELGHLDGEIEVSGLGVTTVDLTAHATGTTVLEQRITGFEQMEVSLNLKETDLAKIRKIVTKTGSVYTPVGIDSQEVIGFGSEVKCNATAAGTKLTLVPKCPPTVNPESRNLNFPNAFAIMDTLTYSGEDFNTIPVTFRILADESLSAKVNRMYIGKELV